MPIESVDPIPFRLVFTVFGMVNSNLEFKSMANTIFKKYTLLIEWYARLYESKLSPSPISFVKWQIL